MREPHIRDFPTTYVSVATYTSNRTGPMNEYQNQRIPLSPEKVGEGKPSEADVTRVALAICTANEFTCIHRNGSGGFPIRPGECGTCYSLAVVAIKAYKEKAPTSGA